MLTYLCNSWLFAKIGGFIMSYCDNLMKFGQYCNDGIHTIITVPGSVAPKLELFLLKSIFEFGGMGLEVTYSKDGTMQVEAFFKDATKRHEFCETIDTAIKAELKATSSVQNETRNQSEPEEEQEIQSTIIDSSKAFVEFLQILPEIQTAINYIFSCKHCKIVNGQRHIYMQGVFKELQEGTLPSDITDSVLTFVQFLTAYGVGNEYVTSVQIPSTPGLLS